MINDMRGDLSLVHEVTPARKGRGPHPCVLLLHGLGSNELDLLPLGPELDERIYTVSARAPFTHDWGGYTWCQVDGDDAGIVNLLELSGEALLKGVEYIRTHLGLPAVQKTVNSMMTSVDLLGRFLKEITEAYPIDSTRLCVAGFSMGAAMTGALSLLHPNLVSATVMLSGFLPAPILRRYLTDDAAHPFFVGHGVYDEVVPIQHGRAARDYLVSNEVTLTYREYLMGHELAADELDDLRAWMKENILRHN